MKRLLLVLAGLLAALPAFSQYYEKAETAFYEARYADAIRTALEGLSAEPARSSEESAVELCSILGASFARLGAFDKAAEYFVRCYRYDKEFGEPEGLSSSLINLASLYVYAGKPELGRSYALEAIGTEKPLNRPAKLAMAYGKACDVYHALEKPDSALYYANLAVASALESGDSLGVAIRRSQRAYPLLTLSRYGEAAEDLEFFGRKTVGSPFPSSVFNRRGCTEKSAGKRLRADIIRKRSRSPARWRTNPSSRRSATPTRSSWAPPGPTKPMN